MVRRTSTFPLATRDRLSWTWTWATTNGKRRADGVAGSGIEEAGRALRGSQVKPPCLPPTMWIYLPSPPSAFAAASEASTSQAFNPLPCLKQEAAVSHRRAGCQPDAILPRIAALHLHFHVAHRWLILTSVRRFRGGSGRSTSLSVFPALRFGRGGCGGC